MRINVRFSPSLWQLLSVFACSAPLSSSSGKHNHITLEEPLLPCSQAMLT